MLRRISGSGIWRGSQTWVLPQNCPLEFLLAGKPVSPAAHIAGAGTRQVERTRVALHFQMHILAGASVRAPACDRHGESISPLHADLDRYLDLTRRPNHGPAPASPGRFSTPRR